MTNIAQTTLAGMAAFAEHRKLTDAVCLNCGGLKNCPGKKPGERCTPPAW